MAGERNVSTNKSGPGGATSAATPPQTIVYELATAHYLSRALFLAAKLKLADLLADGPRSSADLAKSTGVHAPSLKRMMRLLASVGVFSEDEQGNFGLTSVGNCLRSEVPGSQRSMVLHFGGARIQENWKELEHSIRSGEPAFRVRGVTNIFSDPLRTPQDDADFDAAMADLTRLISAAVAAAYDFTPFHKIVDVGGGNGTLMVGILKAYPHLHGIVFDQPSAAERAKVVIADSGLTARCDVVGGDFFKEVPARSDAYLLKHVIHDWTDEQSQTILRNCRRAMPANGKLLIVEGVYPPRIVESALSRAAATNDMNMMVSTGGRQRSEAEFRALYESAGFKLTRIVPTVSRVCVVEGVVA